MDARLSCRRLFAPAKINLILRVTGKRDDGYHDLCTWMQKVDLYDYIDLTLFKGAGVELDCKSTQVPVDGDNLAVRAAESFLGASERAAGFGVHLSLVKNIPVAAGLGGGSSDAGTVLRGLNTLLGGEFGEQDLIELARPLGADVPFLASGHDAVLAEGVGDIMYPVKSLGNASFLLVNPDFFVSTAAVFRKFSLTRPAKNSTLSCFQKPDADSLSLVDMHNDLEQVTCSMHREIDLIKEDLLAAGASKALMSGSGPTVFGVFPDVAGEKTPHLHGVVEKMRDKYGKKVYLTRACTGASPSGKAPGFDPGIRRFESCRPSHH
jgi:4-diphosphocytidyl-2-C-methyl-D-erythritol kinase